MREGSWRADQGKMGRERPLAFAWWSFDGGDGEFYIFTEQTYQFYPGIDKWNSDNPKKSFPQTTSQSFLFCPGVFITYDMNMLQLIFIIHYHTLKQRKNKRIICNIY